MSKVQKPYNKRQHYKKTAKRNTIDVNLKGFLCSCNNREKDCVRETYNILNKYADIMWPPQPLESGTAPAEIEEDLEGELKQLRALKTEEKRFQVVDSGAKNFLFIKTTLEEPVKLAESILQDISLKKTQETRFLLRLVPVETTCKAFIKDIEKAFEPLCEKYFGSENMSYSIVFNHRNNDSVSRDEVIKIIAECVAKTGEEKNLEHKVNLKNANVSIIIEVIRGFAFLGVVPNFIKYKKYNLLAFLLQEETNPASTNVNTLNDD
ncbi:THUMP domain-containing protein 1 homolog [Euwallacea similis]|uniref:THUMP domain-containing protein 1 homolog n=1 Tax=Euwallacea similis TaxID=1736056 RepID=UPI00345043D7